MLCCRNRHLGLPPSVGPKTCLKLMCAKWIMLINNRYFKRVEYINTVLTVNILTYNICAKSSTVQILKVHNDHTRLEFGVVTLKSAFQKSGQAMGAVFTAMRHKERIFTHSFYTNQFVSVQRIPREMTLVSVETASSRPPTKTRQSPNTTASCHNIKYWGMRQTFFLQKSCSARAY